MDFDTYHNKLTVEYASFWQRLTAFMLDLFIVVLPVFLTVMVFSTPIFFGLITPENLEHNKSEIIYHVYMNRVYVMLVCFIFVSLALAAFLISRWQATPGKRLVGIFVGDRAGSKISFANAFGRYISLPLFILMLQIFERKENYDRLNALKSAGKIGDDLTELEMQLNGPVAEVTSMIVFAVIMLWFLKIFFSPERAALHDNMFNTRVFKGKK